MSEIRSHWEPFEDAPGIEPPGESPRGSWEPAGHDPLYRREGKIELLPSSFRRFTVPINGNRIVGPAPYAQRVVLISRGGTAPVSVGSSFNDVGSDFDIPTPEGLQRTGSFGVIPPGPNVFALAPNQVLFGAGRGFPTGVSVSISPIIIEPTYSYKEMEWMPTGLRTYTLRTTGTRDAAIRIVPASNRPQRVIVRAEPTATRISITPSPSELTETPFGAVPEPSGAFTFDAESPTGVPTGPIAFVASPRQALYASVGAGSPVRRLSVSVSEIPALCVRPASKPRPSNNEDHGFPYYAMKRRLRPSEFRTAAFPNTFDPIRIAPATDRWLRVIVRAPTGVAVSSSPEALTQSGGGPGAFQFLSDPVSFIMPPGQSLFGADVVGVAGFAEVQISEALFDCCDYV
jgi:hypothetical protein